MWLGVVMLLLLGAEGPLPAEGKDGGHDCLLGGSGWLTESQSLLFAKYQVYKEFPLDASVNTEIDKR